QLRLAGPDGLDGELRLDHRQAALPAAYDQFFHSHSSSTRRMAWAASAVFLCSSPWETTPATKPPPVHRAGKQKVLSSFRSATLTKAPARAASSPTWRFTWRSSVAATTRKASSTSPGA